MPKNKYRSEYNSSRNSVFNINFHLVWTTKYRKKILSPDMQLFLKDILQQKCKSLDIPIKAIEVMTDHVHIFISTDPHFNLIKTVNILKGFSSFSMRTHFPCLKSLKSLWAPSYFCESIGYVGQRNIIKYINNQVF